MPDDFVCCLCGTTFLSLTTRNLFCPNCGSSQIKKEMGYNELTDEELDVTIFEETRKLDRLF